MWLSLREPLVRSLSSNEAAGILRKEAKPYRGKMELDESGINQIQVGLPILHDGKPIGSLIVGLAAAKL